MDNSCAPNAAACSGWLVIRLYLSLFCFFSLYFQRYRAYIYTVCHCLFRRNSFGLSSLLLQLHSVRILSYTTTTFGCTVYLHEEPLWNRTRFFFVCIAMPFFFVCFFGLCYWNLRNGLKMQTK